MADANEPIPLPVLPPRAVESNKGDYGRALLVGGSRSMSGAIGLSSMSTLRGGAGLVRVAVPANVQPIVAAFNPCYMVAPFPDDEEGCFAAAAISPIQQLSSNSTAIGCGPGIGRSSGVDQLVAELFRSLTQPAVFDADALNALAHQPEMLKQAGGPRVLTPHPLEFARLLGLKTHYPPADREKLARRFASEHRVVLLVKGHRTLITDGQRVALNTTGNPGMATGGTGDVLTGLIVALLCQGLAPFEAAVLGAHLHGSAGDLGAAALGQVSLTALDLVDYLPAAIRHHQSPASLD